MQLVLDFYVFMWIVVSPIFWLDFFSQVEINCLAAALLMIELTRLIFSVNQVLVLHLHISGTRRIRIDEWVAVSRCIACWPLAEGKGSRTPLIQEIDVRAWLASFTTFFAFLLVLQSIADVRHVLPLRHCAVEILRLHMRLGTLLLAIASILDPEFLRLVREGQDLISSVSNDVCRLVNHLLLLRLCFDHSLLLLLWIIDFLYILNLLWELVHRRHFLVFTLLWIGR